MNKPYQPQPSAQELLAAILVELKTAKSSQRLWSLDDIATYLNKSKVTIQQRIVCKPDFPKPVRIPTSAGNLGPLWYPKEVEAYVKRHQKR